MKDRPNHISKKVVEIANPTRPQRPRDTYGLGVPGVFKPGVAPVGGYKSIWAFGDNPTDTKNSPTNKPEKGRI